MKKVLVLCTGNSCRSQMAEGYLKAFSQGTAEIYSAGIETHGLNQRAVTVMHEDGIDISHNTSNKIDEYRHIKFDYVITVCDNALEHCPILPGNGQSFHNSFPDPAKAKGDEDFVMQEFRHVRDLIKSFSKNFSTLYLN